MTGINASAITIQHLDYSKDAVTRFFSNIAHLPWSMLLHSAADNHPENRFDILVADPLATITHTDGQNLIAYADGQTETNSDDPFSVLNDVQSTLLPNISAVSPWPFLGGALGYFGYDLGRQVESLPEIAERDITLPDMAVGIYDWALIADHQEEQLVIIQPTAQDRLKWLDSQSPSYSGQFVLKREWQANMTLSSYTEKFEQVQRYLRSGDCYQINLAQRFDAPYEGDEWVAYQKLANSNGAPFSGFLRLTDGTAVLSVSPERFLALDDGIIETKPIKGTRPRHKDPEADKSAATCLQNAEKDRAENLMIVDLLRNDIGRVAAPGSVSVPDLFYIESFPAVHHLVSTVTGKLADDKHGLDLLRACFPGGSITGAPKVRAMEIIEELEPHRRSVYCGSIGYYSRCGRMDTSITIRTLVCQNQHIYAWAGGGVVADSKAKEEYQETLDKVSRILPVLSG
ncbi:aminodeoxychorismate synthase component I [Veronia nyctiphanis]|uniref:aminodeoxychorismate synthase n=1 Tax=Veronia nyctiphanis TaxID=1278244 RepID=A0A4Q0YN96_9GAMM|nr:aminodeoxychorismate synthase component 1 [Veronia nyctiphanis]RXJ72412.1 aminodeoxychorismate synthase component I [Veronia nyctiphanis]